MKKIGIDLGSASIGWVLTDDGAVSKKGVVTFDTGMTKGQSGGYTSPTRDRREARSKRNLIRARKYRKWALLKILIDKGMVPLDKNEFEIWSKYKKGRICRFPENEHFLNWLACDFSYLGIDSFYKNPYEIRINALERRLSKHEFGRALYHLVQRRGYKDIGETDKETENQKLRRKECGFDDALDKHEILSKAIKYEFLDQGKRARNQYPYREEYKKELELLCEAQGYNISKGDNGNYSNEFVKSVWKAIIWQRPLKTQKGNIGRCTLEPKKLRCPISHPIFEIFRAWQFINTIKYFDSKDEKQPLNQDFRKQLFDWFLTKDKNFKFEDIRKFLDKKFGQHKNYNYPVDKDGKYDTSVAGMPVCKGLIAVFGEQARISLNEIEKNNIGNRNYKGGFGNAPKIIGNYSIYDLWHAVFSFDEQYLEKLAIERFGIKNEIHKKKGKEISISPLAELKALITQGYSDLSIKAMCKIIPFLKAGYLYNEAVVLAKIPELLKEDWNSKKDKITAIAKESGRAYEKEKVIVGITNNLIDRYKADSYFARNDYKYVLQKSDRSDIEKTCQNYFGEKSWHERSDQDEIIKSVEEHYQLFFHDEMRKYREVPTLSDIFQHKLEGNAIIINVDELYHHSDIENRYLKKCKINPTTEKRILPQKANKYGDYVDVLPDVRIDSIKNPMFNKSMSILRRLMNELILNGDVDYETEIVIEVARELNDNNKRIAIERYQNERKNNRLKYREFLEEFKERENSSLNVEDSISTFELWTEQIFEETEDENKYKVTNQNRIEILKEKDAIRRYELWMEQKGQCMYTGKMISFSDLFSTKIDIEHTIPRSLLPDNSMTNQTVCYKWYNTDIKGKTLPFYCPNFQENKILNGKNATSILPRLDNWKRLRDNYKKQYEDRLKGRNSEDEENKNKRIQEKHYFKMHFDYWKEKIDRFETKEIKESWARRQLVDTQMVSKYAREFLKTYFFKVAVQKGSVTADFRKIFGFQSEDEQKSRDKHSHHAIDALVLTLIPVNSSKRERMLKEYFDILESGNKIELKEFFERERPRNFNSQQLIDEIKDSTLIYNYEKDKLTNQTRKNIRKRGKKQFLKDENGKFRRDKNGEKVTIKAQGETIRSSLFAQTYLGKIRDVERDEKGFPRRENGEWKYKTGKEEFVFVKREDIEKVRASDSLIESIIDPTIKKIIIEQKRDSEIRDRQGNVIRHVRIKVKSGKKVKDRINYRSIYDYKNGYYSESGSIPYAVLLQNGNDKQRLTKDGNLSEVKVEREMIPISSFEVANIYRKQRNFDIELYINEIHPKYKDWNKTLLKVGQRVFILNNDSDFEQRKSMDFQRNRLFVITQFSDGNIWLKYHLNALSKDDVKKAIGSRKDEILSIIEKRFEIPEVIENIDIKDNRERREDYENRKYRFDTITNSFRLKRLVERLGLEQAKEIKTELDKYKAIPSTIEIEGEALLLKMSKEKWNFLVEGIDFDMSIDGSIRFYY